MRGSRRFFLLLVFIAASQAARACSPLQVPTLVSQAINSGNLELSWSSNTTYNCQYYIDVEIVCNNAPFPGTGNPPFFPSATITKTSTPFPYPLQLISLSSFCPGTVYQFRAREVEAGNPAIYSSWTATFTFTTPGVFVPPTVTASGNPTLVCVPGVSQLTCTIQNPCGPTAPTYSWVPSASLSNASIANPTASPTATTTYTCYVTGGLQGCWTASDTVTISTSPASSCNAGNNVAICFGSNTQLNGTGGGTYSWAPASSLSNSSISNPIASPTATTTYTLTVAQGPCSSSATVTVFVNPLPVINFTGIDTVGCSPLTVSFTNNTPNSTVCSWTFGDNTGSDSCSNPVVHTYTGPGSYSVILTVTDNFGCVNTATHTNMITVYPKPIACFTAGPQPTTILEPEISFNDCSTGAGSWQWNFGDPLNSASNQQNPKFTYRDTGTFNVQEIVCNSNNCCDTIVQQVYIGPWFSIYVPNSFTPNGDGRNDEFFPKGTGVDKNNYTMCIYDRWGNKIFETHDWDKHWDGKVPGTNNYMEEDVYVWVIDLYDYFNRSYEYVGHVSLVR